MQKNYTLGVLLAMLQSCSGKWDPALKAVKTGVFQQQGGWRSLTQAWLAVLRPQYHFFFIS